MQQNVQKPTADKDSSGAIKTVWPRHHLAHFTEVNPGSDTVLNQEAKQALSESESILFQRKTLDY